MPRKRTDNVRVHVLLTKRQHTKFQDLSDDTGLSMSEIMRRAVDYYLAALTKQGG